MVTLENQHLTQIGSLFDCNHILPSFVYWLCFILYRSCPICQKSCKGRYYYQHIKSHDSSSYSHICKDCGDMFLTKYKLIEHQSLVHTGEASGTFCFVFTFVFSLAHLLLWRGIWLSKAANIAVWKWNWISVNTFLYFNFKVCKR